MNKKFLIAALGLASAAAFAQQAPLSPDRDPSTTVNQTNLAPKVLPGESRTTDNMIIRNANSRAVIDAERQATLHPKKAEKPTMADRQAAAEVRKAEGRAAARGSQATQDNAPRNPDGSAKIPAQQPG